MGVLSCDRYQCPNIMCDRLSHDYGYICNECFDELVRSGWDEDVAWFMSMPKGSTNEPEKESYERFNEMFPLSE